MVTKGGPRKDTTYQDPRGWNRKIPPLFRGLAWKMDLGALPERLASAGA
jgi:hypothetical protein